MLHSVTLFQYTGPCQLQQDQQYCGTEAELQVMHVTFACPELRSTPHSSNSGVHLKLAIRVHVCLSMLPEHQYIQKP